MKIPLQHTRTASRLSGRCGIAAVMALVFVALALFHGAVIPASAHAEIDDDAMMQRGIVSEFIGKMLRAASSNMCWVRHGNDVVGTTYSNLQDAIDVAVAKSQDGSRWSAFTVFVGEDYVMESGEAVSFDASGITITVCSADSAVRTITRGFNDGSMFTVSNGATLRFENITVDGGRAQDLQGTDGGIVSCTGAGTVVKMAAGTTFQNSTAKNQGGAVYVRDSATFEMQAGSVGQGCIAANGGFVSAHYHASSPTVIVNNAVVRNNESRGAGGALFARGATVVVGGVTNMYGNSAASDGWAIAASRTNNTQVWTNVTLSGTASIVDNGPRGNGADRGGGIFLDWDGDYASGSGATLTLSGGPIVSSNRWKNGDKANVVVTNPAQITVGAAGFDTNVATGMPVGHVGVRYYAEGAGRDWGSFALTSVANASAEAYYAFQNDEHPLYTGIASTAGRVQWGQRAAVCKIVRGDGTHAYPTITDAMADANTSYAGEAVTIEMLVADYDFSYEFTYPETIIEETTGSSVPRNYQGVVCANTNGVTITKASASATDGYEFNGGADRLCVIRRGMTYTVYNENESIDLFGSMFRVKGAQGAATLSFKNITLDGGWDAGTSSGQFGRYGTFVFVVAGNALSLGSGAVLQNGHVGPIETTSGYYQSRSGDGGAVYLGARATLAMSDGARIANCTASRNGGAVFTRDSSTITMSYSGTDLIGDGSGEVNAARDAGKVTGIADCSAEGDGGAVCTQKNANLDFSGYWEVDRNEAGGNGGGLNVGEGTRVQLSGYNDDIARVGYNTASANGGGIYACAGAQVAMTGESCCLENRATAGNGGGVLLEGESKLDLAGTGDSTRFGKKAYIARNYVSAGDGAGVWATGGASVTLGDYTTIAQNEAQGSYSFGGGAFIDDGSVITVGELASVSRNSAVYGAGLHLEDATAYVEGTITANTAAHGAGMLARGNSLARFGGVSRVASNTATVRGGGVYESALGSSTPIVQLVDAAAVLANSAGNEGGGVYVEAGTALQVRDSAVVNGNTSESDAADNVHLPANEGESRLDPNPSDGRSEEIQVIGDLTAFARIGIWSENDEEPYEQFGERLVPAGDGWNTQGMSQARSTAYLHQFYNDRNDALRGTWGVNEEVVWGVNLVVEKTVTGDYANMVKRFPFDISFYPNAGATGYEVYRDGALSESHALSEDEQHASISAELGDGDHIVITGLYGARTVWVSEDVSSPYTLTTTAERDAGVEGRDSTGIGVNASADHDVTGNGATPTRVLFENAFEAVLPTGVGVDATPWALVMASAALGAAAIGVGSRLRRMGRRR